MATVRDLTPADASELTTLYEEYEWWDDREVDDVRRALGETDVAVGVEDDGDLVASSRVLTDYTYYANVFDVLRSVHASDGLHESLALVNVIVAADRRGGGLGEALMEAVVDHPDLQSVVGLSLLCRRGLAPYYESAGFELFDREMDVPEGRVEELVRMTYEQDG